MPCISILPDRAMSLSYATSSYLKIDPY